MQNFPYILISYLLNLVRITWNRIPLMVKVIVLLIIMVVASIRYYFFPVSSYLSAASSNVYSNQSQSVSSEIAGGNIKGNNKAGKKNLPIYCVENEATDEAGNEKKQVALSFDAAWGDEDTIEILDLLDKYNVKVTFFMTGGWVDSFPDKVQEIYKRGHDLGNHSQNHKNMSKLSQTEQIAELEKVHNSVKELTGYEMFLFRPPFGDYDNQVVNSAYSINYYPIQWSVDSLDWKDYGASNIVKTVLNHKALCDGAIILMHNGSKYTADALEEVLVGLQDQGYEIVPVSRIIIKENFHMDGTGKQIAD